MVAPVSRVVEWDIFIVSLGKGKAHVNFDIRCIWVLGVRGILGEIMVSASMERYSNCMSNCNGSSNVGKTLVWSNGLQ